VIVEPERDGGGAYVMTIAQGRVVGDARIVAGDRLGAAAVLDGLSGPGGTADSPLTRGDLDEALILDDWMRSRADHDGIVILDPGLAEEDRVDRLLTVVGDLVGEDETVAAAA
jgi:hypothetical protein